MQVSAVSSVRIPSPRKRTCGRRSEGPEATVLKGQGDRPVKVRIEASAASHCKLLEQASFTDQREVRFYGGLVQHIYWTLAADIASPGASADTSATQGRSRVLRVASSKFEKKYECSWDSYTPDCLAGASPNFQQLSR